MNGKTYINGDELTALANSLKSKSENILSTYKGDCAQAIQMSSECLQLSGLNTTEFFQALEKIYTQVNEKVASFADFLTNVVVAEYNAVSEAIVSSFNNEFANEISGLLGISVSATITSATPTVDPGVPSPGGSDTSSRPAVSGCGSVVSGCSSTVSGCGSVVSGCSSTVSGCSSSSTVSGCGSSSTVSGCGSSSTVTGCGGSSRPSTVSGCGSSSKPSTVSGCGSSNSSSRPSTVSGCSSTVSKSTTVTGCGGSSSSSSRPSTTVGGCGGYTYNKPTTTVTGCGGSRASSYVGGVGGAPSSSKFTYSAIN